MMASTKRSRSSPRGAAGTTRAREEFWGQPEAHTEAEGREAVPVFPALGSGVAPSATQNWDDDCSLKELIYAAQLALALADKIDLAEKFESGAAVTPLEEDVGFLLHEKPSRTSTTR